MTLRLVVMSLYYPPSKQSTIFYLNNGINTMYLLTKSSNDIIIMLKDYINNTVKKGEAKCHIKLTT